MRMVIQLDGFFDGNGKLPVAASVGHVALMIMHDGDGFVITRQGRGRFVSSARLRALRRLKHGIHL